MVPAGDSLRTSSVEISLTPAYAAVVGSCWLEQGGCYVCANIRGGGEFGPSWHQAALKENRCIRQVASAPFYLVTIILCRNLAYDDFIAVAEDLIKKRSVPSRLKPILFSYLL